MLKLQYLHCYFVDLVPGISTNPILCKAFSIHIFPGQFLVSPKAVSQIQLIKFL